MKKNYVRLFCKRVLTPFLSTALISGIGITEVRAQVSVTASAGTTSGTYTTLNAAFTAINAGTHTGVIAISITGNTTEPATTVALLASGGTSSYTNISIKPSGGNFTINSNASPSANRGIIELAGADNITIDGDDPLTAGTQNLTVLVATTTSATAAIRISSNSSSGTDGATNVIVKNCIVIGSRPSSTSTNTSYGINFSNYSSSSLSTGAYSNANITIQNNVVKRAYYGVYANGSSSTYPNLNYQILGNTIGSATASDNIGIYGIYLSYTGATTSTTTNALVEGNDISAGDYATGFGASAYGIYISSYNYGLQIKRNNIHDIAQSSSGGWGAIGIYFGSSLNNDITVVNNFIRDVTANQYSTSVSSFMNHGIYISSVGTNLKINHNTIYLNKANATSYGTVNPLSSCIVLNSTSYNIAQFYNNILINNQGAASSSAYCLYVAGNACLTSATNNNCYYASGTGKVGYNGSARSLLSDWQTATSLDASSISENPSFASTTNPHFATGAITLCESGGATTATTGVTVDIDSQTRPGISTYGFGTAPDIGADEFNGQVVYTCTTPAPGATIASSSSICLGSSVNLSLTTATTGTGVIYQWQSSPDNITYTDLSGFTATTCTVSPTVATYYRCKVTCKAGPFTTNSAPVLVTFVNNVLSTGSNVRCGTGTVSLAATGSSGSTLNWYAAVSGGSSLGSGSPFVTPSISSTTSYYVGAETVGSGIGTIGTGTSLTSSTTYPTAFGNYWAQDWTQMVYTAAELQAAGLSAGNITSLAFNISGLPSPGTTPNYAIRMATTSLSSLSTFTTTGLSSVFGPTNVTPVTGWNTLTLTTPFYWDGISNVLIDLRADGADASANATTYYTTTASNTVVYSYYTTGTYAGVAYPAYYTSSPTPSTSTSRFNIRIGGSVICSSPRTQVTATVNTAPTFTVSGTQTVCNNTAATMSVTSTLSNYNTYVWTPAAGLYTDAACTTPYVAGASASTVYAKTATANTITYTCTANNTTTLCGGAATVNVTTLPATVTAIASPANICVSGSALLTVSPSTGYGAATFQWGSSTDNSTFTDISSATTTTYTTPTITSSKYYRLTVKNSAGTTCLNSVSDTGLVYNPTLNSSTGATRCGTGTVTLTATATDGTISWYGASSGGSALGTGTSFTTPTVYSTTTYYAEVRATPDQSIAVGSGGSTLGTSTGDNGLTPFNGYYEGQHTQYLVLASDITSAGLTAGNLSSLSFNISTKNSTLAYAGYTVKLGQTTVANLSSGLIAPTFTTVYGPSSYTTATGANTFNFSSNYYWDGTSNIVVDVCFSNDPTGSGTVYSNNDIVTATTKTYIATYGWYMDNSALCGTTGGSSASSSILPVITFNKVGCANSRTAVVATVNPLPTPTISPATGPIQICDGNSTTLTGGGGGTYQWRNASGLISGATGSTFTTGATGSYRVVVTVPATGCKDSSAVVAVNVNPVPVVSILPSDTRAICADSVQVYTSVATGSGLTYQWFNMGAPITGATTSTLSTHDSGLYTLRVYLGTCSDTSNEANLIVNPLPASSFTKTGPTGAICLDGTLELTALDIPVTSDYQWMINGFDIPAAKGKIYNAAVGGIYTVRIHDAKNCRKISAPITIINTPMGIPDLSPKDVHFCEGTDVILYSNAGPYAASFKWTKDGALMSDTTKDITTGKAGNYYVTATDIYGCVAKSGSVLITVSPLPVKPTIILSGMTLSTEAIYSTYQWYRNGKIIVGATKRNYTISFDGVYHVVVSNNNCTNISDMLAIKGLAIQNVTTNDVDIKVYPNPAQSMVNIDAPLDVNVSVKDMQGKQILELKNAKQVDMANYADGIYIFTITDKEGQILKMDKVVKRSF